MKLNTNHFRQIGVLVIALSFTSNVWAEDFCKSSKITQVAGASVTEQHGAEAERPAQVQDTVVPGDLLKTGADSRAELTAADATVIRVGANSIFSFTDQSRQIELQQGSVLFHTPHGEGGGVIKTAAITAAVTGSTVAMTTTKNGGAKVVPLESTCIVTGKDGRQIASINPGQLLALMPGNRPFLVNIDLGAFVKSSGLIKGFDKPLSKDVQGKIDQNAQKQAGDIQSKTNTFIVDSSTVTTQNPLPNPNQLIETAGDPGNSSGSTSNAFQQTFYSIFGIQFGGTFKDLNLSATQLPGAVNLTFPLTTTANIAQLVVGANITLQGVPDVSMVSGQPGDPNAADLRSNSSSGNGFGVFAAGNMVFSPTSAGTSMDVSLINAPTFLEFFAGGTLTFDGSVLAGGNSSVMLNLNAYDAANLYIASIGTLTLDQACIHSGGNLTVSSGNSDVNLYDGTTLSSVGQVGDITVSALGNITLANVTSSLGVTPSLSGNNINLYSGGQINITGSGTALNAASGINIISTGDTNLGGYFYLGSGTLTNLTIQSFSSNVTIGGLGSTITTAGSSATVNITAANVLTINPTSNFNFGGAGTINLSGNTVNLTGAAFPGGSQVYLKSFSGAVNYTGIQIGAINIIGSSNTYNGSAITIASPVTLYPNIHTGALP